MTSASELNHHTISMPERANMMALRQALTGSEPNRVRELQDLISDDLSPQALYAAVGTLRLAINIIQDQPPGQALATLTGVMACCADRAVRQIPPRHLEISGQQYDVDYRHNEDGCSPPTVWIPPVKFDGSLTCDPKDEDIVLLREQFGHKNLLLIKINDGRERRKGLLSLESGQFVLLPAGTRLQPSDFA